MRIAILMLNEGRGSGVVARQHAAELVGRGHDIVFVHAGNRGSVPGAINIDVPLHGATVPTHEYLPVAGTNQAPVATMSDIEAFGYIPRYVAALEEAGPADYYIGHHANLSAVAVHRVASRHAAPFAIFAHGTGIEPRFAGGYDRTTWQLIRRAVLAADTVIVTTKYVRDELVRPLIPVRSDAFFVLPVGIDTARWSGPIDESVLGRYGLDRPYVICPGVLSRLKGPHNVVAAADAFSDLAETILIGDGELRAVLERRLDGRGRCLGYVPEADKRALIRHASVLVAAPEKREHFGVIYLEALAAATPPVAYRGGGVHEIVVPEVGILTERNPRSLGSAVRLLLQDPQRLAEMGIHGRALAVDRFDRQRLADRLEHRIHADVARRSAPQISAG